jgi:ERF superfamily
MSTEPAPAKGSLARKLAHILGEVGKVEKTGYNAFHKYNYVTENDLVYAVRSKLAEANVFVFTSVEEQTTEIITAADGKQSLLSKVVTLHTFVDGDSGESFAVKSQGQGSDNGDKGGYKAITGAMKYFLYKCFMIPTGDDPEGDDPEGDDKTDERHAAGPASSAPTSGGRASTQTRTEERRQSAEVPRDVTDAMRDQFRGSKWNKVVIHFGKQKGVPLAKLEAKSLEWWINEWQPKGYTDDKGVAHGPKQDDLLLRAALDVANDEWK